MLIIIFNYFSKLIQILYKKKKKENTHIKLNKHIAITNIL